MTALTDLCLWRGLGRHPDPLPVTVCSSPPVTLPVSTPIQWSLNRSYTQTKPPHPQRRRPKIPLLHHKTPFPSVSAASMARTDEPSMSLGWLGSCDPVRSRRDMDRWNDCRSHSDLAVVRYCCSPAPYECLTSIVRLFRYSNDGMLTLTMTHLRWNRDVDLRFFDNQMLYRSRSPSDG